MRASRCRLFRLSRWSRMGYESAQPRVWPVEDPEEVAGMFCLPARMDFLRVALKHCHKGLCQSPTLQICVKDNGGLVADQARSH